MQPTKLLHVKRYDGLPFPSEIKFLEGSVGQACLFCARHGLKMEDYLAVLLVLLIPCRATTRKVLKVEAFCLRNFTRSSK